jgi:hypothetical protein
MRFYQKKFSAAQQFEALRQSPLVLGGCGTLGGGKFHFQYYAQPTVLSRRYLIRISYRQYQRPNVIVMEPDLVVLADNRKLPHVYRQSPPDLCLYLPNTGEWSPDKLISKTILPWSILWLYFFEDWLATDRWNGGGVHPAEASGRKPRTKKKLRRIS